MKSIRACKDSVGDCQVFCSRRSVSDVLAPRRDAATAVASLEYAGNVSVISFNSKKLTISDTTVPKILTGPEPKMTR